MKHIPFNFTDEEALKVVRSNHPEGFPPDVEELLRRYEDALDQDGNLGVEQ